MSSPPLPNLQTKYRSKLYPRQRGKWLTRGAKHHKRTRFKSWYTFADYPYIIDLDCECKSHKKKVHGNMSSQLFKKNEHDDVIIWKYFPRYWPFVMGNHRSPVASSHKGQWCGPLMFSLICVWTNGWENNRDAGDLRHHRTHYDVTVTKYAREQKYPR